MNAAAFAQIQAAALKRKQGWKEPVVKDLKVTKEQYLQEKAEEEAKKNKKAALRASTVQPEDSYHNDAAIEAANTAKNAVATCQMLLRQVLSERQALQQEVQAWQKEMKNFNNTMTSRQPASPQTEPSSNKGKGQDDEARSMVAALETRLGKLDRKTSEQHQKYIDNSAKGRSDQDGKLLQLVSRCEALEKRVAVLEQQKQEIKPPRASRSKSRGRHVTTKDSTSSSAATSPKATNKPVVSLTTSPKSPKPTRTTEATGCEPKPNADHPASSTCTTLQELDPFCQPHSAEKLAKHQARDETLVEYLSKSTGLYPKFSMSVKTTSEGRKLVFFYKKLYIPSTLRESIMQHYFQTHGASSWTRLMAKHVIWPSLDADITNFNGGRK